MKKLLLVCLGGMLVSHLSAATLPFYDSFPNSYAEGERLGSGGSGAVWDTGNSTGGGSPTNATAAKLGYPGLVTTPDSRGILLSGTPGSNRDRSS